MLSISSKSCAEPILIKDTDNINETQEASTSNQICSSPTKTQRPEGEYFTAPIEQGKPLVIISLSQIFVFYYIHIGLLNIVVRSFRGHFTFGSEFLTNVTS